MARSRSSFELTSAIATASTLAREDTKKKAGAPISELEPFRGVALVSFQPGEAAAPPPAPPPAAAPAAENAALATPPTLAPPDGRDGRSLAIPPPPLPAGPSSEVEGAEPSAEDRRAAPKLPDLSNVVSPIVRCEKVVEWITEATNGSSVFIADADGLPIAGAIHDAEARISASGLVASSIGSLLKALPGQPSPLFEVHIGEGPFFQLIGFQAGTGSYVVGLTRQAPLTPRQAHAIRLACRHAFGEPLLNAAKGGSP